MRELIQTGTPMNSLKLAFLGNGEVGKTTLLNAIRVVQEAEAKKKRWFFVKVCSSVNERESLVEL